jgi:putative glutamine amidotransferase
MMPLIGITTYSVNAQGDVPLPFQYVHSVRRAGGLPVLIAPGEPHLNELLGRLDGLVLAGGGDICPTRYGGQMHPTIYMVNPERDASELELTAALLERRMPTLAICRGLQILNVALGGSLHPHLPDVVGEHVLHRLPPRLPTSHSVDVDADSELARQLASTRITSVSWHHQAVDRLGQGCRAVAHAPDGVIEAIEVQGHPEMVAVQWHPELSSATDVSQQQLFDNLVRRSKT